MERGPRIEHREEQPYVAVRARVGTDAELRRAVDRGFPQLFEWLGANGIEPSGPPFIRYLEIARDGQPLEFEVAAPTAAAHAASGGVDADALPAGRYATLTHVGPYTSAEVPDLNAARAELREWAQRQGLEWDGSRTERGTALRACIERYLTDAREEPDWSRWRTELAYLVLDG